MNSFEADLISIFMRDRSSFIKHSLKIKERHFRNKILRFIYKVLSDFYSKYSDSITISVFKNELMKTSIDSEEKKQYFIVVKKLLKRKVKTPIKYIENQIEDKIQREDFLLSMDKAVRSIEKDEDLSIAKKELLKGIILGDSRSGDVIRVIKDWKTRQLLRKKLSLLPVHKRFISTPYSVINATSQGIQVSEAATIAGLTGMGKSIIAGEFGANSLLDGLNIVHFSLENTAEQTAQRYDSRLSEIEYDTIKMYKFKGGQLKHFREVFEALFSGIKNDIAIKETVKDETDIFHIDRFIELQKLNGFNAEFLIVDSCDIMSASKNYESYRLDRASIYWDFKFYCKLKGIPGLTTTQLKSTSKFKISHVEDLAEAYDKARILDIVYIMAQTEEDAKSNVIRFILDKNRDGPSGIEAKLFKDSAKMRFLEIM